MARKLAPWGNLGCAPLSWVDMTERLRRRWPLTSATAAVGCAALGYVWLIPIGAVPEGAPYECELDPEVSDDGAGGSTVHRGEEGEVGKPMPKAEAGLYGMEGPEPDAIARHGGVLGMMPSQAGHFFAAPYGAAYAVGTDDEDVWGSLTGTEVGESYGGGGLGLVGTGRGGGGVGSGTIGLGGRGFDRNLQARTLTVGTVDDFSDARAWKEAADEMAHASAALGIGDEWLGIESPAPRHVQAPDALDVALVLDTTGSMGDELEYLKVELRDIATETSERFPGVDQRWGLVVYRDHGDAYVVRTEDLTELESMLEFLGRQQAGGGGDFPEAMDRALEASERLDWRRDRETARMVFLVADAPPHRGRGAERFLHAVRGHRNGGTAIYPISGSGVDDLAEMAMRVAARATGGQYIYLTDHSGIGGQHRKPHTQDTKIETLHDVMTRMIAQELGGEARLPTAEDDAPPPDQGPVIVEAAEPVELPAVAAPRAEVADFWAELQKRLVEHFLFAMGVSLAVFAAMGVDSTRRRRRSAR